ncbi:MAG: sigma-54 dependent transcriptional regulator [Desulfobacteraceae bacterium]|jgi:DNA-binding NtrC family response regulator
MNTTILIVDDEPDMLQLLKRSLEPELNCSVVTAASAEEGLRHLEQGVFDLVLADIKMPGMNGLEFLQIIKHDYPQQTVVMMTAFGQIDMAVEAIRSGAYDFITKPFEHDTLVLRLDKALERSRLIHENRRLQTRCPEPFIFEKMVGKSPAMRRVFETVQMLAKTDHTVLITGESGTGKDLTAQAIHQLSSRSNGPFVAVNCPTVPENILESELFGYKKGAFTHATSNKIGLFQEAHTGTIFLDEIGDISPAIQTKLLRVLQEKEIKPLGDSRTIQVDVRIIASTNQDLKTKIKNHEFREDVFYRLNVLPIHLPALRDRAEDIPLLCNHLLEKHREELNQPDKVISPELMEMFKQRHWEGNIREMENIIIQGMLFSTGEAIEPADVGLSSGHNQPMVWEESLAGLPYKTAKEKVLQNFNNAYIGHLLSNNKGNITQAAHACGMERQALQQIMRRYSIDAVKYRS